MEMGPRFVIFMYPSKAFDPVTLDSDMLIIVAL